MKAKEMLQSVKTKTAGRAKHSRQRERNRNQGGKTGRKIINKRDKRRGAYRHLQDLVPAFAATEPGGADLPTIAITTDMLKPLVEGVVANIGVVLPVGLALFAIMLGIRIIHGQKKTVQEWKKSAEHL